VIYEADEAVIQIPTALWSIFHAVEKEGMNKNKVNGNVNLAGNGMVGVLT
jgi:hypothetical protein